MNGKKIECSVGGMSLYRTGVQSECSGSLHKLVLRWIMRGGVQIQGEGTEETVVCLGHLAEFRKLGERERYKFVIESDAEVESPIAGERET